MNAVAVVATSAVASGVIVHRVKMLSKTEHLAQILCRPMAKMAHKMSNASRVNHANHVKAAVVNAASAVDAIVVSAAEIVPSAASVQSATTTQRA
jgi:hypothetical protein